MSSTARLRGLYAITDAALMPRHRFSGQIEAALAGGARLIQYRDKSADHRQRLFQARLLAMLCRNHGATLIINDDIDLAAASGAHGVHLGRDDAPLEAARERLGPDAIIGLSCYASLACAHRAQAEGADYVAFGSFFPSPTKPDAARAPVDLLGRACRSLSVPVAAIGGITAANGAELVRAGADMLAVISSVFGAEDVRGAAAAVAALFQD